VVFLDEPTTGVDPVSRRDFWQILYDLPRQGVTVVVSTPYMEEATHCSRIAFMHQGRILAQDSPSALRAAKHCPVIEGLEVFGDRLRAALRPGADVAVIEQVLRQAAVTGLDIRESAASLEEVFVALATRHHSQKDDPGAGEQ